MELDLKKISERVGEAVRLAAMKLPSDAPQFFRGGPNPATVSDIEIDQVLGHELQSIANYDVLSEEGRAGALGRDEYCWVVDPIDGTINAMAGTSDFAISVALVDLRERKSLVGAVYVPREDQLFQAYAGARSTRDGVEISVTDEIHDVSGLHIAAFGINNNMQSVARKMGVAMKALLTEGWVTRQTGAATIDICRVATGSWCGFFEYGLQYWDFAAAALIAEQAGCTVVANPVKAPRRGIPLEYDLIVARDNDMATNLGKALKIDVAETARR